MQILIGIFIVAFVIFRVVMRNARERAENAANLPPDSSPRSFASNREFEARADPQPWASASYEPEPAESADEGLTVSAPDDARAYLLSGPRSGNRMAATLEAMAGPGICTPRRP